MVVALIIVGIIIIGLIFFGCYMSEEKLGDFDMGATFGIIISIFMVIEIGIVASILEKPSPTAMDVYQGKTTLKYEVVDSIKVDSTVVWKNITHENLD